MYKVSTFSQWCRTSSVLLRLPVIVVFSFLTKECCFLVSNVTLDVATVNCECKVKLFFCFLFSSRNLSAMHFLWFTLLSKKPY